MSPATQYPTVMLKPPSGLLYDKRGEGWELVEDADLIGNETLEFANVLEGEEQWVHGETLLTREKKFGRAGQRHLERLQSQVADIPPELDDKYLLGTGTVWRFRGVLLVPCLSPRYGGERSLGVFFLDRGFDRRGVSVRLRK